MKLKILILTILSAIAFGAFADVEKGYLTKKIKLKYRSDDVQVFIHYPQHRADFAEAAAATVEKYFPKMHQYFNYVPQSEVHIVVAKDERMANGMASVFPRNYIYLHDFPPHYGDSLSAASDWIRNLVVHEYAHVLTLEMTFGIFDFLRNFFGSSMKWAGITSRWFTEGIATWAESYFTGEGRVKHPWIKNQVAEIFRMKDTCQELQCSDSPRHYPFGQFPYWVGSQFFDYLEHQKPGSVACIARGYARNLPFLYNSTFSSCTGRSASWQFSRFRKSILEAKLKPFCPLNNKKLCSEVRKKYNFINWNKGWVDKKGYSAFVVTPSFSGRPYGPSEGEKLIVFNKKNNKLSSHYLDRAIERVYDVTGDSGFLISVFEIRGETPTRAYRRFQPSSGEIVELEDISNCDQLLTVSGSTNYCFNYPQSRWVLQKFNSKDDDDKGKTIAEFKELAALGEIKKLPGHKVSVEVDASLVKKGTEQVVNIEDSAPEREVVKQLPGSQSYAGWRYLLPEYLLFNYYSYGNLTGVGLLTSMSDPLNRNNISLATYYNFGIDGDHSPYSGSASYFYSRNKWSVGGGYAKALAESTLTDDINRFEMSYAALSHTGAWGNFSFVKTLSYSKSNEVDIFSVNRNLEGPKISLGISHKSASLSGFYESLDFEFGYESLTNYDFDAYSKYTASSEWNFRITERLHLNLMGAYAKLEDKNESFRFRDGIIFGGGVNSYLTGFYTYPSYLVPFTNIYGDEMFSGKLELDWNIYSPFSYSTSVLFYLKRLNIIAGVENIKSDFILNEEDGVFVGRERDPDIISQFLGLRSVLNVFYIVPLNMDLIYAFSSDNYYDSALGLYFNSSLRF